MRCLAPTLILLASCASVSTRTPDLSMARTLVAHQAEGRTYMTENRFSYRVRVARGEDDFVELPAASLAGAGKGRVTFVSDVPPAHEASLDLSDLYIRPATLRPDGDHEVRFSYLTCLRTGGSYAWDSTAVMRRSGSTWEVVDVLWTGHARGRCRP